MTTTKEKVTKVPTVKSQLPPDQWTKRIESRIYRRKVKRMVDVIKSVTGAKNLSREQKEQAHFWLDAMTFEETRRQRTVSDKPVDAEVIPKDSIKY